MKNQHVDPEGALEIHKQLRARRSLGIHWGTFKLTFEVVTGSEKPPAFPSI